MKANFDIVENDPLKIRPLIIRDIGPHDQYQTVTNAVEEIVEEFVRAGYLPKGRRLFYYDSENNLDEIIVKAGKFDGFRPGNDAEAFDPIPETAEQALTMWDAGKTVFSVQMGGLGPGYDMAIQALAFEMIRVLKNFKDWDDEQSSELVKADLDDVVRRCDKEPWGGFSGAQVDVAKNLASVVCRRGYRVALRDDKAKDRLIQVEKADLRGVCAKCLGVKNAV